MQAMRFLYTQQQYLYIRRFTSRPSFISFKSSQNPQYARHFRPPHRRTIHSTNHHHYKESSVDVDGYGTRSWNNLNLSVKEAASINEENPKVSTVDVPTSCELVTSREMTDNNGEQGLESSDRAENYPTLSSLEYEDDPKDRSLRGMTNDNGEHELESSNGAENYPTLLSLDFQDDPKDRSFREMTNNNGEQELESSNGAENCPTLSSLDFQDNPKDRSFRGMTNKNGEQELESINGAENGEQELESSDDPKDGSFGGVAKASVGGLRLESRSGQSYGNKKKGKKKTVWVCSDCGFSYHGRWQGFCSQCDGAATFKLEEVKEIPAEENDGGKTSGFKVSENLTRSWWNSVEGDPLRLTDVNRRMNLSNWRIPLSEESDRIGDEVARVLGGGVVPGSLVLVGGDPGVGKSTLLLQIAAIIAEDRIFGKPAPVVYVSGEESVQQIGHRADRMKIGTKELFLYSSTDLEDILGKVQALSPRALIIDSIQTVYLKGVAGSAGGLMQVKECTAALLRFAKRTNIPVLMIGHVNKSGDIAGPRVLEHIVDVVLYLEGEKYSSHRLLRSVKNRFGSTDELGVFEMSQSGLDAVSNPNVMFLSEQHLDSDYLAGLAVAVIMDGSRTFLIEIQALCVAAGSVMRQVNGIQRSKADMIIAVLTKQAGLKLQENGVFLNIVSGVTLTDTAGDLAIAAAICSSSLEFAIPNNVAFIGEIGLGGEIRTVPRMEKRVNTVAKLGYKKCVLPKSAENSLADFDFQGMEIVGCKNLKEMINRVFKKDEDCSQPCIENVTDESCSDPYIENATAL
ncbi:uncharacterized protein LOC132282960 [Cornus florida]|uniref:uncharacterized protein LOC132282960 n=1 Tax=Cornus florida TaxID=4283 RepID=UPI002899E4CE|nr:uncharacterized protein LOC132282960 [Cornus florida]